jgi:predicted enzyme related to lactoylglutathione lyase
MPHNLSFFAIHADDVPRARKFYEQVFGWKFQPWGPPGFLKIRTGTDDDPGVRGALQKRHELVPGQEMIGFECTIAVDDIEATFAAVEAQGVKIIMPICEIPNVLRLFKFLDTEGNVVCAGQYAEGYRE